MKTPESAYSLKLADEIAINGKYVYFTVKWIENDEYRSSIYRFDGSSPERVTYGGRERSPLFFRDSLYYISTRESVVDGRMLKTDRLMRLEPGKEPVEIFSSKNISKVIFHRGSIYSIVETAVDEDAPFATSRLKYRFNSRGLLRSRKKLAHFRNELKVVVEGDFDVGDIATNGKRLIFTSTEGFDDYGLQNIFELNTSDNSYSRVTGKGLSINAICVADNGAIAYTGHDRGTTPWAISTLNFPEENRTVSVSENASNEVLTDHFTSGHERLIYDSGTFYLIGQDGGSTSVYSVGDSVERMTDPKMVVRDMSVANGEIAYIFTNSSKPSIVRFRGDYDLNPDVVGVIPEHFSVNGRDFWYLSSGSSNPTILSVHGGPHSAYGYAYYIEFNFLVSNGFNVLYGNPRGSQGYGEDFSRACVGDWGGGDYEDLMAAVEESKHRFRISDRFAITGGSYGGFMSAHAITRTDRFKCAIVERPVTNLMSMCGTSDIGFWFNATEAGIDDPWSQNGMLDLLKRSPVFYAKNVRTPVMFIHGEEDYRCPIEQSEQMYMAVRMNGIDSVLVRSPGDSHDHAREGVPRNMKDRLRRKLEWFNKYLKS